MVDFDEAMTLFAKRAAERGWNVAADSNSRSIWRGDAGLRLRHDAVVLVLEITHGPLDAPGMFWIDLYAEPPDPDPEMPTLDESIIYGLDLMGSSLPRLNLPSSK